MTRPSNDKPESYQRAKKLIYHKLMLEKEKNSAQNSRYERNFDVPGLEATSLFDDHRLLGLNPNLGSNYLSTGVLSSDGKRAGDRKQHSSHSKLRHITSDLSPLPNSDSHSALNIPLAESSVHSKSSGRKASN